MEIPYKLSLINFFCFWWTEALANWESHKKSDIARGTGARSRWSKGAVPPRHVLGVAMLLRHDICNNPCNRPGASMAERQEPAAVHMQRKAFRAVFC